MIICHLWSVDPVFSAYLYCYLLMRFCNNFSLNIVLLKHICNECVPGETEVCTWTVDII